MLVSPCGVVTDKEEKELTGRIKMEMGETRGKKGEKRKDFSKEGRTSFGSV